jgi:hypothetical protein
MANNITICGALANTHGEANGQELLSYLAKGTNEWDIYIREHKLGVIRNAAFDWQAILSTTANLINIGDLIWRAYERFIKPLHDKDKKSKSFLTSLR